MSRDQSRQLLEMGAVLCCGARLGAGELRLGRRDDAMVVVWIEDKNCMKRRQVQNYLKTQTKGEFHRRIRVMARRNNVH